MTNAYDFTLKTIDGADRPLKDYAGKTLLIVNVASRCGLTPQYSGLEELYRDKKERGLVVLGVPCNQFGGQEPGTPEEIKDFCSTKYDVTFPLFAKVDVNGKDRHPLYAWLTGLDTKPDAAGDVLWNFAKFLVDGEGNVVARFGPKTAPTAEPLLAAVEQALGA
jgi:glutathione peroxidase